MSKKSHKRVALEAAQFLVDGTESEYLQAKQRAVLMLGLSDQTRLPSNREIRELMTQLTRAELGDDEVQRRVIEMRQIAQEIMCAIPDSDPFLIGSTLSGQIRDTSDIDLHAYSDNHEELQTLLSSFGCDDIEPEIVENRKGRFVHLKWWQRNYPVEITVYPWSWRDVVMYSSVTGKPMKRADLAAVKRLNALSKPK